MKHPFSTAIFFFAALSMVAGGAVAQTAGPHKAAIEAPGLNPLVPKADGVHMREIAYAHYDGDAGGMLHATDSARYSYYAATLNYSMINSFRNTGSSWTPSTNDAYT